MPNPSSMTTVAGADANRPALPPDRAFVVQFSLNTDVNHGCFAGRVEHVVSGRASNFASTGELLDAIASQLEGGGA